MSLFNEIDYRKFLNEHIKLQPKKGHGYKLKIAEYLCVHPTLITQILKGQKSFSIEQAFTLTVFLNFNDLERDYFLTLIEYDRSGTVPLKKFIESKLFKLRQESEKIKNRVPTYTSMSESDQAVFYSHWFYSAIRLSCGLEDSVTKESISKKLNLPIELVEKVLEFLVSRGLVVQKNDVEFSKGPNSTFLPDSSPLISRHHMNWRQKAIEKHPRLEKYDLSFSAPLTIAKKDIPIIRKIILELIQDISSKVKDSPPESLACLNIDWFQL